MLAAACLQQQTSVATGGSVQLCWVCSTEQRRVIFGRISGHINLLKGTNQSCAGLCCALCAVCWPRCLFLSCRLTDSQIKDNILLLLFAGHETSSSALTLCFSNLQDNPAALQKLRGEQRDVVAKHGPQITPAALKDMQYAEAVIRCVQGSALVLLLLGCAQHIPSDV